MKHNRKQEHEAFLYGINGRMIGIGLVVLLALLMLSYGLSTVKHVVRQAYATPTSISTK